MGSDGARAIAAAMRTNNSLQQLIIVRFVHFLFFASRFM